MRDPLAGLEGLQEDMRAHQLRTGKEPTGDANQRLAAAAIQRAELETADQPPPSEHETWAPPVFEGRHVRDGQHGQYTVDQQVDDVRVRKATPAEHWFIRQAMPRIEMLLEKRESGLLGAASWRDRVLAVLQLRQRAIGLRHAGAPDFAADLERRFTFELVELLEASSTTFGDWKAEAPTRISLQVPGSCG